MENAVRRDGAAAGRLSAKPGAPRACGLWALADVLLLQPRPSQDS